MEAAAGMVSRPSSARRTKDKPAVTAAEIQLARGIDKRMGLAVESGAAEPEGTPGWTG